MRFKIDENLPVEAAQLFIDTGHNTETVFTEALQGKPDEDVAERCRQEGRALVTLDRGFADLRAFPPTRYPGIVVLRPRHEDKPHVLDLLERMIPLLGRERLDGHLWVVEESRIRIRPAEDAR